MRTILHVDLDAFFCSVEELLDPGLKGRAFVVGGNPEGRGVVSSASYPARKFGVRSGMPTAQALRQCPGLLVVRPRHGVYGEHSERVMDMLREAVPAMEQLSVDEAFLDVTEHPLPGEDVAPRLQKDIDAHFGLPTSWGVAENKLLAKIATNVGKPHGLVVVPPGEGEAFLAPLPVAMLWGVGPVTQAALARLGIRTIGDLTSMPLTELEAGLGERASELAARGRGEDSSPVVEEHAARSISNEVTFARDVADRSALLGTLRGLAEQVGRRARAQAVAGTTVRLKLRWADFTTITRQTTLPQPTDQDGEIFAAVRALFLRAWAAGRPVRLLGVGISGLGESIRQLSLFDHAWEQDAKLLKAVDTIRARYGRKALKRLSDLKSKDPDR